MERLAIPWRLITTASWKNGWLWPLTRWSDCKWLASRPNIMLTLTRIRMRIRTCTYIRDSNRPSNRLSNSRKPLRLRLDFLCRVGPTQNQDVSSKSFLKSFFFKKTPLLLIPRRSAAVCFSLIVLRHLYLPRSRRSFFSRTVIVSTPAIFQLLDSDLWLVAYHRRRCKCE